MGMCACVHYHIPLTALKAANPALVKGPLNSRVTLLTSPCTNTSYKLNAWAHTLHTRHMNSHSHCRAKLCALSRPCYSLSESFSSSLSEMSPNWKQTPTFLPLGSSVSICLASVLSVHLSPSICLSLWGCVRSPCFANTITNNQWTGHLEVDVTTRSFLTGSHHHRPRMKKLISGYLFVKKETRCSFRNPEAAFYSHVEVTRIYICYTAAQAIIPDRANANCPTVCSCGYLHLELKCIMFQQPSITT